MRLLRLFAIFVVATLVAGFSCFAQSTRSANQTRSKACSKTLSRATAVTAQQPGSAQEKSPAKAGTAQQAGQDSSGRAQSDQTAKITIESLQKAIQEAREREHLPPYQLLSGKSSSDSFDGGIYLRQTEGANVCAAIVSYNFSSGENPRLESVTTCTPGNAVTSKRARGPNKMPQGPHVVRTTYQEQDKK
jgi:hypothetical protein